MTAADDALARLKPLKRWVFGTTAKAEAGIQPVRNQAQLAADFDPYQSWTSTVSINNEWGRFQPLGSGTHAIGADALWLTGRIDRTRYKGGYETVPAVLAEPSRQNAGGTVLILKDVPPQSIDGAGFGWAKDWAILWRNNDYRVSGVAAQAKVVTIYPALTEALPAGTVVQFVPPIMTGQICTKDMLPLGQGQVCALRARLVVPDDTAKGAWPGFWLYGKNDASVRSHPNNSDEIDVFEGYRDRLRNARHYSGNNHTQTAIEFHKEDAGWKAALGGAYREAPQPLAGDVEFTCVIEPGMTHKFVNGVLVRSDRFEWKNPRPPQAIIDLAIGSMTPDWKDADLRPTSDACFAGMKLGVRTLEYYSEAS